GNAATGAAIAIECSGALAARRAVAGVRARLPVRHLLVCRNLLLDLRHHASLWRDARSRCRTRADLVLHVRRALSRAVRAAAGLGRRIDGRWTKSRGIHARRIEDY